MFSGGQRDAEQREPGAPLPGCRWAGRHGERHRTACDSAMPLLSTRQGRRSQDTEKLSAFPRSLQRRSRGQDPGDHPGVPLRVTGQEDTMHVTQLSVFRPRDSEKSCHR